MDVVLVVGFPLMASGGGTSGCRLVVGGLVWELRRRVIRTKTIGILVGYSCALGVRCTLMHILNSCLMGQ